MSLSVLQICDHCAKRKSKDCRPAWSLKNKQRVIRCIPCRDSRQGCSFVNFSWPIDQWPSIFKTKEGDSRRAANATAKRELTRKKVALSAPVLAKSRSEGSSSRPVRKLRTPVRFQDDTALSSISSAIPEPPATQEAFPVVDDSRGTVVRYLPGPSSVSPVPINWYAPSEGRSELLFVEGLARFEKGLSDPNRTRTSIGTLLSELAGTKVRESNQLAILEQMVTSRRPLIDELLVRLEREMVALKVAGVAETSGASSSRGTKRVHEEVEDDEEDEEEE